MRNLWKWAEEELKAPYERVRDLWCQDTQLDKAMRILQTKWAEEPVLTVCARTTAQIDEDVSARHSGIFQEFRTTPQYKLIELIGRSGCGGAWNSQMCEMCFRKGLAFHAALSNAETAVIKELRQRVTGDCSWNRPRKRSHE